MNMVAAYIRVSTVDQNQALQRDAIERWSNAYAHKIVWYQDKFTGKTMDRPGWEQLEADYRSGKIGRIVVWKMDRLGRTMAGLAALFKELQQRNIGLISLTEGFDISTPAGKLAAHVMAAAAEYELEVSTERRQAGIRAARERNGGKCPWGGSEQRLSEASRKALTAVRKLNAAGCSYSEIARTVGMSRKTVTKLLREES